MTRATPLTSPTALIRTEPGRSQKLANRVGATSSTSDAATAISKCNSLCERGASR